MDDSEVNNEKDCNLASNSTEDGKPKLNFITLEECFKAIVEGCSIEFDLENLNSILKKDLQVNFYYLKPKLKSVIPYMLIHFIKCWPGWQKSNHYLSKQITFNSWYAKFREYLVFKINYLIKNDYEKVQAMLKTNPPIDNVLFKIDNNTQTIVPSEKPTAPYSIAIQGIPKILNSLVFCEGLDGSIMVKEYKTKPFPQQLTTKQLINWPYVEIEFSCNELSFKRKNMHDFKRYLMLSKEKISVNKFDTFIEEIDIINEQITRAVYTLNVLREYCGIYVAILRKHKKVMEITDEYIDDIKTAFDEFLSDITDLNMNSMATNTSVLFNIGMFNYARNKSIRTSDHAVSFAECITPKVNLTLYRFTGIKDEKSDTPFQGLHDLLDSTDSSFIKSFLPTIKYNCTYCNLRYGKKEDLFGHFKEKHCMEQPVLCFVCKQQMDVATICENRWNHTCPKRKNEETATR